MKSRDPTTIKTQRTFRCTTLPDYIGQQESSNYYASQSKSLVIYTMEGYRAPTANDVDENGNEIPRAAPEQMNIKFSDHSGFKVQFRLKPTTKLGKAMDHYSARVEKNRQTLRFLFEGERLLPDSTPKSVSNGFQPVVTCGG